MSVLHTSRAFVVAVAALAGCGEIIGLDGYTDGDASVVDAGGDATTGDAKADTAADAPATDTGTDAPGDSGVNDGGDGGVTGVSFVCPVDGGAVSSCAQCAGSPEPCVYCLMADASVLTGQCVTMGTSCSGGIPNNYQRCACTNDAGVCPESYQVCRGGNCRTCSDSTTNNGLVCKGGGTCDSTDGGCI